MGNIGIRSLEENDARRWLELWGAYLAYYKQELPGEITQCTWRRILDPSQALRGNAALDATGRIVGFVHFHFHLSTWSVRDICYLEDLFVDATVRGRGAGRALIESVYRDADAVGATRVYWHTENTNHSAQALYDRVGVMTSYLQYRRRT